MPDNIKIKVINAAHRGDRRSECIEEFGLAKIRDSEYEFFLAKYIQDMPQRGCALSHALSLVEFLVDNSEQFVVILEDDFKIRDPSSFSNELLEIIQHDLLFDVFLLGHNQAVPVESGSLINSVRVINSQTASGYVVNRRFAPDLVRSFLKSAENLEGFGSLPEPNRFISRHIFAADMLWQDLQNNHRFITRYPALITQRRSYSDIEKRVVDYGV